MNTSPLSRSSFIAMALSVMGLLWECPRLAAQDQISGDWATVQSIITEKPAAGAKPDPEWVLAHQSRLREIAWHFYETHPSDVQRWRAAQLFIQSRQFGREDREARDAYFRQLTELLPVVATSAGVPPDIQEYANGMMLARASQAAKGEADFPALDRLFDSFVAKYPQSTGVAELAGLYFAALERTGLDAPAAAAERYASSPIPALAKLALSKKTRAAALRNAGALKFTAADGHEIDLAQLRGKVVLIDFWATWCGPCKEELPNVVANFKKYHDQGFEVVGITFENAGLKPTDDAAQQADKLGKAQQAMLNFTRDHEMPWPQYFDGKYWRNELAAPFAVTGIPFMLLLDKSGQVVSTNARGPALEEALKKYLAN